VCSFLGTRPADMIKTLIFAAGGHTHVALARGDHDVNEAKLRGVTERGLGLADENTIRTVTGAAVGFAGPMGLAGKVHRMVIDHAVAAMAVGVTGANRTDYHMRNVVPGRDFPLEGGHVVVADIRNAVEGDTHDGKPLRFSRGVEVGHVFKLGDKYSKALGCKFLDEAGKEQFCLMGCYGIGINRILASAIELFADANGICLPAAIAPFDVEVLPLNRDKQPVVDEAERIYRELSAAGYDVLLDDRDARPGVKFKDADLIGIPLRVVIGERGLKEGNAEIKRRSDERPTAVPLADVVPEAKRILDQLKR